MAEAQVISTDSRAVQADGPARQPQRLANILPGILPWAIGLGFVLLFFPAGYLDGSAALLVQPTGDFAQHQAGILAYLNEPWHWPPMHSALLIPPEGTPLVYTDSLPGPSLVAKAIQSLTGWRVPVLGWWMLATFLLQPVAMASLLRALGVERPLPLAAGAAISLALPWFLWRFGHTALAGHFLLLFQLALVMGQTRSERPAWRLIAAGLLAWFALLVHAYLFLMVAVVGLAGFADSLRLRRIAWQRGVPGLLLWLAGALALMAVSGYLSFRQPLPGYGFYSFNLLSPFVPQASGLLPGFASWLLGPSKGGVLAELPLRPHEGFADLLDATGGQYEGFAWLGFGILLLLAATLATNRRWLRQGLRRHALLALAIGGLTLAALSNQIWIGHWRAIALPEPPDLIAAFRSSGRLVWPLLYLGVAVTIAAVARIERRQLSTALLCLAVLLQVADARPLLQRLWEGLRSGGSEVFPAELWQPLVAAHERLDVFPRFQCINGFFAPARQFAFHAAAVGRPVNTMAVSRQRHHDCGGDFASLQWRRVEPGTLLIILDPYAKWLAAALPPALDAGCRAFNGPVAGLACTADWQALDARGLSQSFAEP